jgi:hypothetical protein
MPNSNISGQGLICATVALNISQLVALGADSANRTHYAAFTTGAQPRDYYYPLNKLQCQIDFQPKLFSVAVDIVNRTIQVTPGQSSSWIATSDDLTAIVVEKIQEMSAVLSGTLFTSLYGNAFMTNINNIAALYGSQSDTAIFNAVQDSISSIVDDLLVVYASARLIIANDTLQTEVLSQMAVTEFGTSVYIYSTVAINLVFVLVYVMEAVRTRYWRSLSELDFLNIKRVIVGTSLGGVEIGKIAQALYQIHDDAWEASTKGSQHGNIIVQLQNKDRIVAANSEGLNIQD